MERWPLMVLKSANSKKACLATELNKNLGLLTSNLFNGMVDASLWSDGKCVSTASCPLGVLGRCLKLLFGGEGVGGMPQWVPGAPGYPTQAVWLTTCTAPPHPPDTQTPGIADAWRHFQPILILKPPHEKQLDKRFNPMIPLNMCHNVSNQIPKFQDSRKVFQAFYNWLYVLIEERKKQQLEIAFCKTRKSEAFNRVFQSAGGA